MELYNLVKLTKRSKKRLGQGYGSGRGKTAGRGTKGQKMRAKIPLSFEGGGLSLIKRLPFLRGKGKNKVYGKKQATIKLGKLSVFKKGEIVDVQSLVKNSLLDKGYAGYSIKILNEGEIVIPLKIKINVTKGARKKIEKAGGEIIS